MPPTIPQNLSSLVRARFFAAKATKELIFYPTSVVLLRINTIPFQLRFSPAIASKPKSKPQDTSKGTPLVESSSITSPFLDPPPALLICDLPPSHILVLNKFAIVPAHFILATKEFKPQTALLEETDLEAAWGCLKAWRMIATDREIIGEASRDEGEGLFAFFNSGACSGASQPHRHIQLLPVEMMRECLQNEDGGGPEWSVLADRLVGEHALDLPFKYFAKPLPQNPTARQLHSLYIELYERACRLVGEYVTMHPDEDRLLSDGRDGECAISYNLGLTDRAMVLCPRRAEGSFISDGNAGNLNTGSVSLNGTVLAGTLLVKNETEWNILKNDVSQLTKILGAIGIPSLVSTDEMI